MYAKRLKMTNTHYDSPHGLINKNNYSSAYDMAILVCECMKIDLFRQVVRTKHFEAKAASGSPKRNRDNSVSLYRWNNSNKLLSSMTGIIGCKTGVTKDAGPCLATYYERPGIKLAIILCNSFTMDSRWSETREIVDFFYKENPNLKKPAKNY